MLTTEGPALAWAALAVLAIIVEVSIPHFGLIFVGVGAIAGGIAALLSFDVPVQVVAFGIVTVLSFAALRRRFMTRFGAQGVPSRTETLVGRGGVVTLDIDPAIGTGRVNVGGEDWAARAPAPLAAGTNIRVVGADGIVLEVRSQ